MSNWKVGARQHFSNQRTVEKLVSIKVPEWGIDVYYWPATTMEEERQISLAFVHAEIEATEADEAPDRAIKLDRKGRDVAELIARGRDEHGRNLFTSSEFDDVMAHYDPRVIERVVGQMNTEQASQEAAEKN